jgi:hypothetical protein
LSNLVRHAQLTKSEFGMASYELSAFDRFHAISVVGAIEQQTPYIKCWFWFVIPIN